MVVSRRKGFTNINGSSREGDELKDVMHTSWKLLECVKRDNHLAIERGGEPKMARRKKEHVGLETN